MIINRTKRKARHKIFFGATESDTFIINLFYMEMNGRKLGVGKFSDGGVG